MAAACSQLAHSVGWLSRAGGEGAAAVSLPRPSSKAATAGHSQGDDDVRVVLVGGANGAGQTSDDNGNAGAVVLNITAGRWVYENAGEPPCARTGHTACALRTANGGEEVVVLGGCSLEHGYLGLSSVHVFDVTSSLWRTVATSGRSPSPRDKHCAFSIGQSVYVFGGFGPADADPDASTGEDGGDGEGGDAVAFSWFNDLHRLDTESWRWECVETTGDPPAPRAAAAACLIDDEFEGGGGEGGRNVLVFGGRSAGGRNDDTYTLEGLATGKQLQSRPRWIRRTSAESEDRPPPRSYHTLCRIAGSSLVWLFGGLGADHAACDDLHVIDTSADGGWRWSRAQRGGDAPRARAGCGITYSENSLVVYGGYTESDFFDDIALVDVGAWLAVDQPRGDGAADDVDGPE